MNKKEYIKKNVVLRGHGVIKKLAFDAVWFKNKEKHLGKIKHVLEIKRAILDLDIEGCIVVFESGAILCAESDGEWIDMFIAKR